MDRVSPTDRNLRFTLAVLPHLDAAFNLARWSLGEDSLARDAVQAASVRALSYLDTLRGNDGKAWFLGIVRNQCFDLLRERTARRHDLDLEDYLDDPEAGEALTSTQLGPEQWLERQADRAQVNAALASLPVSFREVLILREMEELSYADIARITDVPVGTVMSRLARGRALFRSTFLAAAGEVNR